MKRARGVIQAESTPKVSPTPVDFLGKARFDRYRFVAVLGKGSFAEVAKYEVVDAASPAHPLHDGGGAAPAAPASRATAAHGGDTARRRWRRFS